MNFAVIGVPYNSAGSDSAEAIAPRVLREEGLISELAQHSDVIDYGDVAVAPTTASQQDGVSTTTQPELRALVRMATRAAVERAYDDQRMPILIGGDRLLLLGGLLAARDQLGYGPALLFVDGHAENGSLQESDTSTAAVTELERALGYAGYSAAAGPTEATPLLDPHQVVVLGARDHWATVEGGGRRSIRDQVIVLDDAELRGAGIQLTVKRWLDQFLRNPGRFWFHLAWDVLTADDLPAVPHSQPGGLTWDELETIARAAIHADHLIGMDVTLYNPDRDPDRASARHIVSFLAEVARGTERAPRFRRL